MSVVPPAVKPTSTRTGLAGHCDGCAAAVAIDAMPIRPSVARRRCIVVPLRRAVCARSGGVARVEAVELAQQRGPLHQAIGPPGVTLVVVPGGLDNRRR